MCRWLAYTGSPVLLTQVLYTPVHSLIDQSLHSRLGAQTTNGDGFGVGWKGRRPAPALRPQAPAQDRIEDHAGPRKTPGREGSARGKARP
jgi:predicted glutamine amidotransferase